jgi:uncharacterized protein YndB with AHSA1/START domain
MTTQPLPQRGSAADITLVVRRTIAASPAFLFDAWTQPQQLVDWWGPAGVTCPHAEVDLRPGGALRIANLLPDGRTVWITGKFEKIDRPKLLVYSWQLGEQEHVERVTVRFEPRGDACELIVTHERIVDATSRDQHETGWKGCLDGLERHISLM